MDERGISHYTAGFRQDGDKLKLEIVYRPKDYMKYVDVEIKVNRNG